MQRIFLKAVNQWSLWCICASYGILLNFIPASACSDNATLITESRQLLHTYVEIKACGDNARDAIASAFTEMIQVNDLLNNYNPESEVSRINNSAGGNAVTISAETYMALQTAQKYCKLTGGALDITVGPLVKLWGFAQEHPGLSGPVPGPEEIRAKRALVDYRSLHLEQYIKNDAIGYSARLNKAGMWIDVGSFSKGFCADRAVETLKKHGIISALVAVGGTICAIGKKPGGSPWKVAVRHPRKEDDFLTFMPLVDASISTSGDYERYYTKNNKLMGHIIDPRTGTPVERMQSVSVLAKTGMESDALSTGIFVLGPQKGVGLIEQLPETSVLLVTQRGAVIMSKRWPQKIVIY